MTHNKSSHSISPRSSNGDGLAAFDESRSHPVSPGSQEGVATVIWRRKWSVVLILALCLGSAAYYLHKATPLYRSTARIYVEQRVKHVLQSDPSVVENSDTFLALQCEIMKSSAVLSLIPDSTFQALAQQGSKISPDSIKGGLVVDFTIKDGIIQLTYDSPNPMVAADIVNGVVDAYAKFQDSSSLNNATDLLKLLETQKVKRDQELSDAEDKLSDFRKKNQDLGVADAKDSIILERLSRLSESLGAAELKELEAKSLMTSMAAMKNDQEAMRMLMQLVRSKGMLPVDDQESAIRNALGMAQDQYNAAVAAGEMDKSPHLKGLKQQIDSLAVQLQHADSQLLISFPQMMLQQWDLAEQNLKDLRDAFEKEQHDALDLNGKTAELLRRQSTVNRCEKLCDMIDDRIKDIQISQDVEGVRVGVLERGTPSPAPAYPQPARTLGAAGLMGLIFGIGCAMMRNWVDKRIRSSDEVHSSLRVPVLGVVPRMSGRRTFPEAGQCVHLDPRSTFAEAYRAIRTGVFFGTSGAGGKKLVITSPESGDGKTMTVSNLAIAIAQAGQRTLIVDADMRNPAQHKIFGIDNDLGLVEVLAGSTSLKEAIIPTEVANLHILPSGPVPLNPSEMLSSQSFTALLDELSARYDYVIIDSPPVLSVTDAGILGAVCDMTVLVLRWNRSTARVGQDARDVLLSVGARIFGGIVNDVPRGYSGRPAYYYGKTSSRRSISGRSGSTKQLGAQVK